MWQRYRDRHGGCNSSNSTSTNMTSGMYIISVQMTSSKITSTSSHVHPCYPATVNALIGTTGHFWPQGFCTFCSFVCRSLPG